MTQLSISFRDMDPSPALEALIQDCTDKLGTFAERIERCNVVVERPHRHHHSGQHFHVRIHLAVPGPDIEVSSSHDHDSQCEDAYAAVRAAFQAARRQLEVRASRRTSERRAGN